MAHFFQAVVFLLKVKIFLSLTFFEGDLYLTWIWEGCPAEIGQNEDEQNCSDGGNRRRDLLDQIGTIEGEKESIYEKQQADSEEEHARWSRHHESTIAQEFVPSR